MYGAPVAATGPFYVNHMGQEYGPLEIGQLAQMASSGQLKADSPCAARTASSTSRPKQIPGPVLGQGVGHRPDPDLAARLARCRSLLPGLRPALGILKLITFGGCGIWSLIDAILVTLRKIPDAQGRPLS